MSIIKRTRFSKDRCQTGFSKPVSGEEGSALIIVLIVLMVLTLLGQIATRTTYTEMKIATNDRRHRVTFYDADGATELATELLEQNIDELGFDGTTPDFDTDTNIFADFIGIDVDDFWRNSEEVATTPTDVDRDFFLPAGYAAGEPHTNFTVGGRPELSEGAGIPMAAGYEGLGKGSAHGGSKNIYELITRRIGEDNSESIVRVQWRHVN